MAPLTFQKMPIWEILKAKGGIGPGADLYNPVPLARGVVMSCDGLVCGL